jgi:branched-chain amino acid transport system ATP-binding protein
MLELSNVTAGYGKMAILEDVSLCCEDNEAVIVFGPNGAGKTTLMQTIYRFADLHHGDIRYNDLDLARRSPHEMLPLGVGYIRQRGGVFLSMTVRDNFRMALYSLRNREIQTRLERVFSAFPRLEKKLGQTAMTLSGGEKKMLAIGCVLAQDPDLILVDEISEGLQPMLRDRVIQEISKSAREGNKAVIFVEEATEQVLKFCDRAYCLRDGKIGAEGPSADFLDKRILEKLYFGERNDGEEP